MTNELLASMDINFWCSVNPICPTCGADFSQFDPHQNLFPHWVSMCKEKRIIQAYENTARTGWQRFKEHFKWN